MSNLIAGADLSPYQLDVLDAHYSLEDDEAAEIGSLHLRYQERRQIYLDEVEMLRHWAYGLTINILAPTLAREETPDTAA